MRQCFRLFRSFCWSTLCRGLCFWHNTCIEPRGDRQGESPHHVEVGTPVPLLSDDWEGFDQVRVGD